MVRGAIPFRGQILTDISNTMLEITKSVLPNAQLFAPANSAVVIAENCEPFMFEMVWRMHMCKSSTETSLYYHYVELGKREFCGHLLPEGLTANGPLPYGITDLELPGDYVGAVTTAGTRPFVTLMEAA